MEYSNGQFFKLHRNYGLIMIMCEFFDFEEKLKFMKTNKLINKCIIKITKHLKVNKNI
jgi:hypothetical protein